MQYVEVEGEKVEEQDKYFSTEDSCTRPPYYVLQVLILKHPSSSYVSVKILGRAVWVWYSRQLFF